MNTISLAEFRSILIFAIFGLAVSLNAAGVGTNSFINQAATPTFSPQGGTYTGPQLVSIFTATPNATIFYTTDGSQPNPATAAIFGGSIYVAFNTTIRAIATAPGFFNSAMGSAIYVIVNQTATPTFSPGGGIYNSPQMVTISCASVGAVIHYTLNGSTPTAASTIYFSPITIAGDTTINALAIAPGLLNSSVGFAIYTIATQAAAPIFYPRAGTYKSAQSVTLACATTGATIHYTTDGSLPTLSSPIFIVPLNITAPTTVEAFAVVPGLNNSSLSIANYVIIAQAGLPVFHPPGGTYRRSQTVTLTASTSDTTIFYTTDGSLPTRSSTVFSAPIEISSTTTINAKATSPGLDDSLVSSATYVINLRPAAAPLFSPPAGAFNGPQQVSLSSKTNGAVIYYTTDGSTPTVSSPVFMSPIDIAETTTINAMAAAPGFVNSKAVSATYTILPTLVPPQLNIYSMTIKLNFAQPNQDSIVLAGSLPLDSGADLSDQTLVAGVGGLGETLTLSRKGVWSSGPNNSFRIKSPVGAGALFQAKFSKGSFASALSVFGLINATTVTQVTVPVAISINQQTYQDVITFTYKAAAGKSGVARAP
jgi:hypothetical protein